MAILENSLLKGKKDIFSKNVNEPIIDLSKKTFRMPEGFLAQIFNNDIDYAARPDIVSKLLYGSGMYGDLLAKLNGYGNPFEFPDDDVIIVPDASELKKFFYDSDDDIDDSLDDVRKPVAKKKNEPRKANEAVVGDTRFKIDSSNRIVIY